MSEQYTVLITGAASGIGEATVHQYIEKTDLNIVALDLNVERLAEIKAIAADRIHTVAVDLTNNSVVADHLLPVLQHLGPLAHIISSHGIGIENQLNELDKWDRILDVNLHSTQRLLALLETAIIDGGRVVILSSILGRAGRADNTGYVTSKHALLGLTKALAFDWAKRKITVNAVLPCWVDTPMLRDQMKPQADFAGITVDQMLRRVKKRIPLRSLVSAEDVAETIFFLTSSGAKMITAQGIVIDGGFVGGA